MQYMKLLIVQTSPLRTASTVLVNALYGMIPQLKNKPVIFLKDIHKLPSFEQHFNDIMLIKTDLPIENFNMYTCQYKIIFICSQRKDLNLYVNHHSPEVIIFDYEELNETDTNPLFKIIENIHHKIKHVLPINLDKKSSLERILAMNARYKEIEKEPFTYHDKFFQIHGSHRNRGK